MNLELELELQVVAVASLPKEIAAGLQPKQNNSIRGLLLQSGWVVEKLQNDSCIVTYIAQVRLFFIYFQYFNNVTNYMKIKAQICCFAYINIWVWCDVQLDPAGWLPKCFVNRLNTKLVMIIENLKKQVVACPTRGRGPT